MIAACRVTGSAAGLIAVVVCRPESALRTAPVFIQVNFAFAILVVGPIISIALITAYQVPRALALTVRLVSVEFWIPIATLEV